MRIFAIKPVRRWFIWPHPFARDARRIIVRLVVGYRYFVDGRERRRLTPAARLGKRGIDNRYTRKR